MNLLKFFSVTLVTLLILVSCIGFIDSTSDGPRPYHKPRIETLPAGDYVDSCSNCSVSFGELNCWCKNRAGFEKSTSISLRSCTSRISNEDGRLVCGRVSPAPKPLPYGTYKDSCSSCSMDGTVLRCSCKDSNGFSRSTSLETYYCNQGVSNDDGRLVCGSVQPKPKPLPYGTYKDSCSSCSMSGSLLRCSCKDTNGLSRNASLETEFCNQGVSNDDGRLVCGPVYEKPKPFSPSLPSGSYKSTCRACSSTHNKLSCECEDSNGIFRSTSIWLSGCYKSIENCDGRLNCGGC